MGKKRFLYIFGPFMIVAAVSQLFWPEMPVVAYPASGLLGTGLAVVNDAEDK